MESIKVLTVFICVAFLFGCNYTKEEKRVIDSKLRWSEFCKEKGGKMVALRYDRVNSYYCNDGSHTHFGDNKK